MLIILWKTVLIKEGERVACCFNGVVDWVDKALILGKYYSMAYYNYHGRAKKLIKEGMLVRAIILKKWNGIEPALVLFFKGSRPMPIRRNRWIEYEFIIRNTGIIIENAIEKEQK